MSVWCVVATSLRCLLVLDGFGSDEQQTIADTAKLRGCLYVDPRADMQPGDVIVMRGRMGGKFTVTAQGQVVPDRHGFSHHCEWKVSEL